MKTEALLDALTLEEKISLLSGADEWSTPGINRLGIGPLKTTDGPAGARGALSVDGPTAALLPAPVLQAATWSRQGLRAIGEVLQRETLSKGACVLLAPTICCLRNPLGGRNFESFSEDPFLSGSLAIEYVAGVQATGKVAATAKHFVANEQEHRRFSVDVKVSESALREVYLRPFEMLMRSSTPPRCLMTSYNKVNGFHLDMHKAMLTGVVRDEWTFDGVVMSDWGGTNSTAESLLAGCDLEMPGPSLRRGKQLLQAVETAGDDPTLRTAIDASCGRMLKLAADLGLTSLSDAEYEDLSTRAEVSSTSAEDIATLRGIAARGMVLLKNDASTLPLDPDTLRGKTVTFIGPNALRGAASGGGSAAMNPQYLSQPFDAFRGALRELAVDADVRYAQACSNHKWLPLLTTKEWTGGKDATGKLSLLRIDFFHSPDCSGEVLETQYRDNSSIELSDSGPPVLRTSGQPYSFRMTSVLTPSSTGEHSMSLSSIGGSRLFLDGKLILDNTSWTGLGETFYAFGSPEARVSVRLGAGTPYNVTVEAHTRLVGEMSDLDSNDVGSMHLYGAQPSTRVGYLEQQTDGIEQAVDLAAKSDLVVMVVGLNDQWESEGYDRQSMALPGDQDKLVREILQAVKHPAQVVIVNQSGSPVEMPWADDASTILQAWYGGQEAGNALSDVLLGMVALSGRLPMTWPVEYTDLPFAHDRETWPGIDDRVEYKEGSLVGYRWFQEAQVQPMWWFGHGLTYTTFEVTAMEVIAEDEVWRVAVSVQNTGPRRGREVVQLYVASSTAPHLATLQAFDHTQLMEPGEVVTLSLVIALMDVARWQDDRWALRGGKYRIAARAHAGAADSAVREVILPMDMQW